jgi:hypothetical protein
MRERIKGFDHVSGSSDMIRTQMIGFDDGEKVGQHYDLNFAGAYTASGDKMLDEKDPLPPCRFKAVKHDSWRADWKDVNHYWHGMTTALLPGHPIGFVEYELTDPRAWVIHMSGVNFSPDNICPVPTSLNDEARYRLTSLWEEKLIPQMKSGMDILVFLAELDEIPALVKSLAGLLKKVPGPLLRELDGMNLKEILDSMSHRWLEYNFALRPLIQDLITTVKAAQGFLKQLYSLAAGAGKPQKVHGGFQTVVAKGGETSRLFTRGSGCYPGNNGNCPYLGANPVDCQYYLDAVEMIDCVSRYGITVFYQYELPPDIAGLELKARALLSAIGLKPSLETIWELIPFSFVLDWVFPVGDIVSRLKNDPLPIKTQIMDLCMSVRTFRARSIEGRAAHGCWRNPHTVYLTVQREYYERVIGADVLDWIPNFRLPNLFQLSLGAALGWNLGQGKRVKVLH